ncbi:MAG: hypothetical protein AUG50_00855 [Betaproteobacteria bacterium 13_1_20CM_3_63_8]|nr:MAG: hypothetical protein AUG50_00855 [Betaproteobacteria bacterium 13_1_20CM_3_63_8]
MSFPWRLVICTLFHWQQRLEYSAEDGGTLLWHLLRESWSRDVSEDVAHELRRRRVEQDRDLPEFLHEFVERYEGTYAVQLPLRLP